MPLFINKKIRFERESTLSAAHFVYESENTDNNGDRKTLEVSGGQFEDCVIEKTPKGFRLTFPGNWEEQDLFNFFRDVGEELFKFKGGERT